MTRELTNVQLYSEMALQAIRPMDTMEFTERVLVRELLLLLMREDFDLDDALYDQLYDRTRRFGLEHHRGSSAADTYFQHRAKANAKRKRSPSAEVVDDFT